MLTVGHLAAPASTGVKLVTVALSQPGYCEVMR